jgi:hypothetical protein
MTTGRDPIETVWTAAAVLLPVLVSLLSRLSTIDLAYQLRAGDQLLSGGFPRVDTYTFTARGSPWVDQQWLAQGVLASVYRWAGGWPSLAALQALLIGTTFWLLYMAIRSSGVAPRTASVLTLAGFVITSPSLALRPQLFAIALFAALLFLLAYRRERPRLLWLAPVLTAGCANVHGSFPLFPLVIGLAWLEDRRVNNAGTRHTFMIGAVSLLATLANPFGLRVWTYAYDVSTNPVIRHTITEWAPVSLRNATGWLMVASGIAVVVYLVRRRPRPPWTAVITLALFFLLALSAQRALVWWGLVAPLVIGDLIADKRKATTTCKTSLPEPGPRASARSTIAPAYAIVGLLGVCVVALLPWWRGSDPSRFLRDTPFGVSQAAASLPAGTRILAYQPWGSWFELAVPNDPVFVDSRIEVPSTSVWDDYRDIVAGDPRSSEILDRWRVDAIAAPNDWRPLPLLEAAGSGWRVVYRGPDGVLLRRS